ncbi:MAG: metalloregulator ArsR/SmtB family transcription factor [Alphaproteobacteria bacterium]|nr:metalloregulator ArsR/SmtB family transcription factor [Alphaproteobacteria bacterium]MCD8519880.1 metalloregulator ArsR/SmtB family transcription factor [Alphaproteobacteria bacterium]MCD8525742.1 metalloregulator ArsR/SmtB family transcription factor [Alphaproteobacteria bacterium]MCD8571005.1 metalloregulator ArsR/SmtB family transcription factor [Alphaproteobacteria bacterium]
MTIRMENIEDKAEEAAGFLKGLASPHRLLILCQLTEGEKSVSALIEATGLAQTSMSQHLLKLREENIVTFRRDHRTLYYRISHDAVQDIMAVLYSHFCKGA